MRSLKIPIGETLKNAYLEEMGVHQRRSLRGTQRYRGALMNRSRDTQDSGSNGAPKEKKNKSEEERETANLENRKQKKSPCTCLSCRTMMIPRSAHEFHPKQQRSASLTLPLRVKKGRPEVVPWPKEPRVTSWTVYKMKITFTFESLQSVFHEKKRQLEVDRGALALKCEKDR